jgi:hypothetical protein
LASRVYLPSGSTVRPQVLASISALPA